MCDSASVRQQAVHGGVQIRREEEAKVLTSYTCDTLFCSAAEGRQSREKKGITQETKMIGVKRWAEKQAARHEHQEMVSQTV